MRPAAILSIGATSALGRGPAAYSVGAEGGTPVSAITRDSELSARGLAKPFLARALHASERGDPAEALLLDALGMVVADLDRGHQGWRTLRIGFAVGTSSGGMVPLVRALELRARGAAIPRELAERAPYFGPLRTVRQALGVEPVAVVQVLAACASSGVAIGLGTRWLELGEADLVIAGGYDAVSPLVASGFESLGATSATRPRPFRVDRDGMALGEAAVFFAMTRPSSSTGAVLGYVSGFAATSDAVHVTAPDRTGTGLARALTSALADAGATANAVDLVSAHATATPYNDRAESLALGLALGPRAREVVVHPFKAVVGHTLGASAALELAAALDAMNRGILPAALGDGPRDPECAVRLLAQNEKATPRTCLKLSAAFGGSNASLVASIDLTGGPPLEQSTVSVASVGEPRTSLDPERVAAGLRVPPTYLTRMDPLSSLVVSAAASALEGASDLPLDRTGVVVGTSAATLENDEAFDLRLRERGAKGVEPRKFPATSPNLPAGQCSIAFGLRGPALSVGAGLDAAAEALLVAHDLLASGDADAMVVVAAEDVGEVVRDVFRSAGWQIPAAGAVAAVLRRGGAPAIRREELVRTLGGRAPDPHAEEPGWPSFLAVLRRATRL